MDRAANDMSGAAARRPLPYAPGLDGLRAVAVAAVVVYHLGFGWAGGGFLGVSLFFTLSGYLITSLLLREHAAVGGISLAKFWARRGRRIAPALLVTLAGVTIGARWLSAPASLPGDVRAALFEVANWRFIGAHRSYAALFTVASPLRHLWSLAIEEQCYVVLPIVVIAALRLGGRRALAAVLIGLAGVSVAMSYVLSGASFDRVYQGTDTRAVELLAGAALACFVTPERAGRARSRSVLGEICPGIRDELHPDRTWRARCFARAARWSERVAVAAATSLLMAVWAVTRLGQHWLRHGFGLLALVNAVVVLGALTAPGATVFGRRPLVALGKISYGLYLFHWPIVTWLTAARTGWHWIVVDVVRVVASVGLAALSYRFVERPIRRGALDGRVTAPLGVGAVAAVVVAGFVVPVASPSGAAGLIARYAPATVPTTLAPVIAPTVTVAPTRPSAALTTVPTTVPTTEATTEAPVRRPTVWLAGDSVPYSLAPALDELARAGGDVVVNLAVPGCDGARGWPTSRTGFGADTEDRPDCLGWEDRWPAFATASPPDAVVFVLGGNEVVDRLIAGQWRSPCDDAFRSWYEPEVVARVDWVLAHTAATPMLTVTPYADASAARLLGANYLDGVDCLNAVYRAVAAARPRVALLDLASAVCPSGRAGACLPWRPVDGLHFDGDGARLAARWLLDHVIAALGSPP